MEQPLALSGLPSRLMIFHSISTDRVHQNSSSMHFRRANMDSGGPIRIQEGQYGFRRANMEPSVHFRKANTEPSVYFRRANTETYQKQNKNLSKRVGKDRVFLGLVGLLPRISLWLRPQEIPRSRPASPRKTPSFPPLLLRLTKYLQLDCPHFYLYQLSSIQSLTF